MHQDNNNPVVQIDVTVISARDVGAHDPFGDTADVEVINGILSFNGIWPCSVLPAMNYTYETHRLFRLELFKMDYLQLLSETSVLGWSQYRIEVGSIISEQHLPTAYSAFAEGKSK